MVLYYCLIKLAGEPGLQLTVLDVTSRTEALCSLPGLCADWQGLESLELYRGEDLLTCLDGGALKNVSGLAA